MKVRLHHPELDRDILVADRAVGAHLAVGWEMADESPVEHSDGLDLLPPPPAPPTEGA